MRRFVVLVVVAVLGLSAGASAATLGEQRVLLILTTWRPEPYTPASIRAELYEAAATGFALSRSTGPGFGADPPDGSSALSAVPGG